MERLKQRFERVLAEHGHGHAELLEQLLRVVAENEPESGSEEAWPINGPCVA